MEPHKATEPLLEGWKYRLENKPEILATKPTVDDDDSDDGSDDLDGWSKPWGATKGNSIISYHFPL